MTFKSNQNDFIFISICESVSIESLLDFKVGISGGCLVLPRVLPQAFIAGSPQVGGLLGRGQASGISHLQAQTLLPAGRLGWSFPARPPDSSPIRGRWSREVLCTINAPNHKRKGQGRCGVPYWYFASPSFVGEQSTEGRIQRPPVFGEDRVLSVPRGTVKDDINTVAETKTVLL